MSTAIEWTDVTWNPTTGCDRVSPGCDNCYALTLAKRLKGMASAKYQTDGDPRTSGPGFGLATHGDVLDLPLRWQKPRRVFVNSMSDLFHARVPRDFVAQVWDVMERTPRHTYQILTKRPDRMAHILGDVPPLPNVWLGTSVENQKYADLRVPFLMETSAAIRFLSCEPLLGPLELTRWMLPWRSLDWVITGGESGPGFRPADPAWFRSIRYQCAASTSADKPNGVAYLHKQNGGRTPKAGGRELDGRTWDDYPAGPDETDDERAAWIADDAKQARREDRP